MNMKELVVFTSCMLLFGVFILWRSFQLYIISIVHISDYIYSSSCLIVVSFLRSYPLTAKYSPQQFSFDEFSVNVNCIVNSDLQITYLFRNYGCIRQSHPEVFRSTTVQLIFQKFISEFTRQQYIFCLVQHLQ